MIDIFNAFYHGKRVLVTGHTGFKGSWLSIWLHELGAEVIGVAQEPFSERDNFVLSGIGKRIKADIRADICDGERMKAIFREYRPDIVFHLAAQPLVRLSYDIPVETYRTNVMGTINILEAIRVTDSVKVSVMITTDKCYENKEQIWGYRENEPMGGYDPYSSSKGAAEIAIASWRRSFFNPEEYEKHGKSIASVRAGNVIGGGDWALDRIIPDCIRHWKWANLLKSVVLKPFVRGSTCSNLLVAICFLRKRCGTNLQNIVRVGISGRGRKVSLRFGMWRLK